MKILSGLRMRYEGIKKSVFDKIFEVSTPKLNHLLLYSGVILYTLILSYFMISKHRSFATYAWDLGIFNQAFYTTAKLGETFYYTCELHFVEGGSFFGIHFIPILYARARVTVGQSKMGVKEIWRFFKKALEHYRNNGD